MAFKLDNGLVLKPNNLPDKQYYNARGSEVGQASLLFTECSAIGVSILSSAQKSNSKIPRETRANIDDAMNHRSLPSTVRLLSTLSLRANATLKAIL